MLGRWEKQGRRQEGARERGEDKWMRGKEGEGRKEGVRRMLLLTLTSNMTKVVFPKNTWVTFKIWLVDYKTVNKLALCQKINQLPYGLVIALLGIYPREIKTYA